ncbi:MAG: serine hydrolase [Dehalococcoidia bacterium]|nr:serine hydrolase [Dehalococcoidia bacterium]
MAAAGFAAIACSDRDDADGLDETPTLVPLPTVTATPTEPATATPEPTPSPTPDDSSVSIPCAERGPLEDELAADIEAAMEGYDGTWGFALRDLGCDRQVAINPEYSQYPASASKILTLIAVMRAVDAGEVDLEQVEPLMETVIRQSLDHETDLLEDFIEPQALGQVMEDAGASDASYNEGAWRYTFMTAPDMARVWAALVEGELLSEDSTEYLVDLATTAEIPEDSQTFPSPADFEKEGFQFGQKAGYYVFDGVPYDLVGAGYLLHEEDPNLRFVPVLLIHSNREDLSDQQRRQALGPVHGLRRRAHGDGQRRRSAVRPDSRRITHCNLYHGLGTDPATKASVKPMDELTSKQEEVRSYPGPVDSRGVAAGRCPVSPGRHAFTERTCRIRAVGRRANAATCLKSTVTGKSGQPRTDGKPRKPESLAPGSTGQMDRNPTCSPPSFAHAISLPTAASRPASSWPSLASPRW